MVSKMMVRPSALGKPAKTMTLKVTKICQQLLFIDIWSDSGFCAVSLQT